MSKYDNYYIFDDPVPYRNLKLYPVRMRDYLLFHYFANVLVLDKNSIPDFKIITMTYLEWLFHETETDMENKPYILWLDRLLEMVLKDDESFSDMNKSVQRYRRDEKGKPYILIGDQKYDSSDFEEIKMIIAEQNDLDLPDESIQKELRDSIEEANRIRQRLNKTRIAPLEEQIVAVSIYTGWPLEQIYDLTIRKYGMVIQRSDHLLHYKIYLTASLSGMVEFKDKSIIKHWLSDLKKDRFGGALIESETVKNKISLSDKLK